MKKQSNFRQRDCFISEVITALISFFHRTDNHETKTLPRFSIDNLQDKFNVTSHINDIRSNS